MDNWWPILFWSSVAGLAYVYLVYPVLIGMCGRFRDAALERAPWTKPVSVVIVVHNEAGRLQRKLDGLFRSEAAERICEVLVTSDGSTDDTARAVAEYPDARVRLVEFDERRGKPACLNELVPQCRSDVVVLTDARQRLDPAAISRLLELFADVRVGAVSGELVFDAPAQPTTGPDRAGCYRRYETWMLRSESRFRSAPGAGGAFYAVRRNVFRPIPDDTVLDDVVIPMKIIERGYHCAFEPGAIAYEEPSPCPRRETARKRRTIAGCAQLLWNHPRWLMPDANPIWWEYVSHRIGRLFSPLWVGLAAAANAALIGRGVYSELAALQGMLYLAALLGWHYQRNGTHARWCAALLTFVRLNLTTLAAWWDALRGRVTPTWQRAL